MKRKALDSNVVATLQAQLKALLPTFEQFLSEEATEPAHQGGEAGAAGSVEAGAEGAAGGENAMAAGSEGAAGAAEGGETGTGEVAAEGATEGGEAATGEEGETDNGAVAGAEGGEQGGAGAREQLISSLKAMLAQLEGGEAGDEGAEGGEAGEATNAEGEQAGDTVEGLEGTAREGEDEGATSEQGSASEGPAAGKHTGADAALRRFHADLALKNRLSDRLSKVVGAFDGALDVASATARDVAVYGIGKLKIKCAKGQEVVALDAYLTGIEAARKTTSVNLQTKRAADAAQQEVPAIAAYFKE